MAYLFTSESVSEGHPDKVADQISDALLDQFLAYDDQCSLCHKKHFVLQDQVVIMGEVRSNVYVDLQTIARKTIKQIGYTKVSISLTATLVVCLLQSMNRAMTSTVA